MGINRMSRSELTQIQFETSALIVKNLLVEDVTKDYADWLNDPQVNQNLSIDSHQTKESCIEYVESFENRNDSLLLGLFIKGPNLHIGNISISMIDIPNRSAWIGISIGRKEYWGKGLAKEALISTVTYLFNNSILHSINAGVTVDNLSSINLFFKSGFKIVGLLKESSMVNGKYEDGYILTVLESDIQNNGSIHLPQQCSKGTIIR